MRPAVFATMLLGITAFGGCGSTQIFTTDPSARILVDGKVVGKGHAEITQRGTPGSTTVLVKTNDGREERKMIERRFTAVTLVAGIFTYGICLFACWEYPDTVYVPVSAPPAVAAAGQLPGADPWLVPPPGWTP